MEGKAWYALNKVFEQFRSDADSCACSLYPLSFREYERLWPQDLMYSSERYEGTTKESTDFSKLFAGYERLSEGVASAPRQGRARKKRRRAFFTSEERAAFVKFVVYFRECAELWRKYFATSAQSGWVACARARISRGKLPAAIDVLERAIENVGGAPP